MQHSFYYTIVLIFYITKFANIFLYVMCSKTTSACDKLIMNAKISIIFLSSEPVSLSESGSFYKNCMGLFSFAEPRLYVWKWEPFRKKKDMGVGEDRVMWAHYIHTLKMPRWSLLSCTIKREGLRKEDKFQDLSIRSSWIPRVDFSSITLALGWREARRSQSHTERAMWRWGSGQSDVTSSQQMLQRHRRAEAGSIALALPRASGASRADGTMITHFRPEQL